MLLLLGTNESGSACACSGRAGVQPHCKHVMPQSRSRSGGFMPPFSRWRGEPAPTFEIGTETLRPSPRYGNWRLGYHRGGQAALPLRVSTNFKERPPTTCIAASGAASAEAKRQPRLHSPAPSCFRQLKKRPTLKLLLKLVAPLLESPRGRPASRRGASRVR